MSKSGYSTYKSANGVHSYMLQRGIKQSKSAIHEYAQKTLQNPQQFGYSCLQEYLILEVVLLLVHDRLFPGDCCPLSTLIFSEACFGFLFML